MDEKNKHDLDLDEVVPLPKIKGKRSKSAEEWLRPDRLVLVRNWVMWGATEEEVAERIGITQRQLKSWRTKYREFDNAIRNAKDVADALVENALYKKAIEGDNTAMTFWLKNRKPEAWRETKSDKASAESIKLDNEIKRLKIEQMETANEKNEVQIYTGIPADDIAAPFMNMHHAIQDQSYSSFILPGGRGSTKSSFISLELIDLLEKNPNMHACVCRQVGDTLRTSVYTQITWAIEKLGLEAEYKTTRVPLEITKASTGQKIYFRGADDPGKLKSIAVPFGHIGIVWLEELDQFKGEAEVRKILQSLVRGGETSYVFYSFNPPKSKNNWANEFTYTNERENKNALVTRSTYLDVPPRWLGQPFIDQAEYLKEVNPIAYENEYMGVANSSGGLVFENIEACEITDEMIQGFDEIVNGVDFGYYPAYWALTRCYYDAGRQTLYIFDEERKQKTTSEQECQIIREHGILPNDLVICDCASPKDIAQYRNNDINARGCSKVKGARDFSYKWLATRRAIVIDPERCPGTYEEFINYEFERDSDNNPISAYPKENDHSIDAVRYATEKYSRREASITI